METFTKEPAGTEPPSDAVPDKPLAEIIEELDTWHQELFRIIDRGRRLNGALTAAMRRKRDMFQD
jgi:hypothetical protein